MKKIISLILCASLLCGALSGCGETAVGGVKQTNESLTLWFDARSADTQMGLKVAIDTFKAKFPEVELVTEEIEVTDEGIDGTAEFCKKLGASCMAGDGPDIIYGRNDVFTASNDLYKMQAAGAFADLTEFIKNDKEFNVEDYNKVIFDGVKFDDKQYVIPLAYKLHMIYSPKELFEKEGFNAENFGTAEGILNELAAFRERNPNDKALFTDGTFFRHFFFYTGLDIIDREKQTVDFDNPLFKKGMELWKAEYPHESFDLKGHFNETVLLDYFPDGSAVKGSVMGSNILGIDHIFGTLRASEAVTDSAVFVPWRNTDGGVMAALDSCMMVNNTSANKQNAWEFIKCALLKEAQEYFVFTTGIPINKAAWEKDFEPWTLPGGIGVGLLGNSDERLDDTKGLTEETYDYFVKLNEEITGVYTRFSGDNKIFELFEPYFKGEKDYDECKADASEWFETYLSE